MTSFRNSADKGVSVSIPQGYTNTQIDALAKALYLQFFRDHVRYCYQLSPDHTQLTVFAVN